MTEKREQKSHLKYQGTLSRALVITALVGLLTEPMWAYIGPGAGFAFISSFFTLLTAMLLALFTLLSWPARRLIQGLRFRKRSSRPGVERVVVVGLDGLDPELTEDFMDQGDLPNLSRLRRQGAYSRLQTTLPAESPVAWSSFQTGCNPGRHGIFDFLSPNRKTYLPELSSTRLLRPIRTLSLGNFRIPLGAPVLQLRRHSRPFWKTLGEHGVFSSIIRVPVSFPPEPFHGVLLSGMSVPDLRGSQGTFSYFTNDPGEFRPVTGGELHRTEFQGGVMQSAISGPEDPFHSEGRQLRIPFLVQVINGNAQVKLQSQTYSLPLREFTPWIRVSFRSRLGLRIRGLCRFFLKELSPHFKLYLSPVQIDPEKAALPISHPWTYSSYLAKTQGPFATQGLAEDTWALNEDILDEEAFLHQAYLIHEERERMLFDAMEKTRHGAVVCVFDITDRIQHMFWRYLDDHHPANNGRTPGRHRDEIAELYRRMDSMIGRILARITDKTVLMVMSDHGFKSFKRGVNLNSWLQKNGYLSLNKQPLGGQWFSDVDWSGTRAYALGLSGIYLNQTGREARGTVDPEQAAHLKQEIIQKLRELHDEQEDSRPIREVYDARKCFEGPYVDESPDLIVGFSPGYRISWSGATGKVTDAVFEDNVRRWSGDHCLNPSDVPGVFFCNRKVDIDGIPNHGHRPNRDEPVWSSNTLIL